MWTFSMINIHLLEVFFFYQQSNKIDDLDTIKFYNNFVTDSSLSFTQNTRHTMGNTMYTSGITLEL